MTSAFDQYDRLEYNALKSVGETPTDPGATRIRQINSLSKEKRDQFNERMKRFVQKDPDTYRNVPRAKKYLKNYSESEFQDMADQELRDSVNPSDMWRNALGSGAGAGIPTGGTADDDSSYSSNPIEQSGGQAETPVDDSQTAEDSIDTEDYPQDAAPEDDVTPEGTSPGLSGSSPNVADTGEAAAEGAGKAAAAAENVAAGVGAAGETAAGVEEGLVLAGEAGAVAPEAILLIIGIVVLLLVGFTAWNMIFPSSAAGTTTCATTTIDGPNTQGDYQLPVTDYYTLNSNGGSPRSQQWGNKDAVEAIVNVGKTWSSTHSDQKFSVGDLNAPGHLSHTKGNDVDIYNDQNKLMAHDPDDSANADYDKDLTIELGKRFLDTNAVEYIFYNDPSVISALNDYLKTNKLSGKVESWPSHWNHFHVRFKIGVYECVNTAANTSSGMTTAGVLDVPYQNQFKYGHTGACSITSMAMVASYITGTNITENSVYQKWGIMYVRSHLNTLVKSKGVSFSRYPAGASESAMGTDAAEKALKLAEKSIADNHPVILRVLPPFAAKLHTVVITGFDKDGNVYVNDPNNSRGAPPYIKVGKPKGKNNLADRTKLKKAMIYIDYVK